MLPALITTNPVPPYLFNAALEFNVRQIYETYFSRVLSTRTILIVYHTRTFYAAARPISLSSSVS